MSIDLKRHTPYAKKGDQIVPLQPHHYLTLFYGGPISAPDGTTLVQKGRIMYDTQRLYVCDGCVYKDEKTRIPINEVSSLYPWFWDEYAKIDPELRREVRLVLPEDRAQTAEQLPEEFLTTWESLPESLRQQLAAQYVKPLEEQQPEVAMWTCPDCGEETKLQLKGAHRSAKHRKVND